MDAADQRYVYNTKPLTLTRLPSIIIPPAPAPSEPILSLHSASARISKPSSRPNPLILGQGSHSCGVIVDGYRGEGGGGVQEEEQLTDLERVFPWVSHALSLDFAYRLSPPLGTFFFLSRSTSRSTQRSLFEEHSFFTTAQIVGARL